MSGRIGRLWEHIFGIGVNGRYGRFSVYEVDRSYRVPYYKESVTKEKAAGILYRKNRFLLPYYLFT